MRSQAQASERAAAPDKRVPAASRKRALESDSPSASVEEEEEEDDDDGDEDDELEVVEVLKSKRAPKRQPKPSAAQGKQRGPTAGDASAQQQARVQEDKVKRTRKKLPVAKTKIVCDEVFKALSDERRALITVRPQCNLCMT